MRFLKKNNVEKTVLVISDLHLGAGAFVHGKKNFLEDFHHDQELTHFITFFSQKEFDKRSVELIINGDFLDFLAVPYVHYFDNEFWSEEASLEKLELILRAHKEVFDELNKFLKDKNNKITYILGNHDGELIFASVREKILKCFDEDYRERFVFRWQDEEYEPIPGVIIKHGHEYEKAHNIDPHNCIVENQDGRKFYSPPWGSYYVTRIVNKFKEERDFINQIRPIKSFLIYGLIFDTLFTLRFMLANAYYFIMVRFLYIFKSSGKFSKVMADALEELELFKDEDELTKAFFQKRPESNTLIIGHTHEAQYKSFPDGKVFINTGTWTRMYNLDFAKRQEGYRLTFAQIDHVNDGKNHHVDSALNVWKGSKKLPYQEF